MIFYEFSDTLNLILTSFGASRERFKLATPVRLKTNMGTLLFLKQIDFSNENVFNHVLVLVSQCRKFCRATLQYITYILRKPFSNFFISFSSKKNLVYAKGRRISCLYPWHFSLKIDENLTVKFSVQINRWNSWPFF